jgi:uncharacterized protein (DUF983 family)
MNHVNLVNPVEVMKRDPRTIFLTLGRCLKLRCPACGRASIVERPFNLKHRCTECGVIFKREEGFFVGAIMANVIATEGLILVAYFFCLLFTNLGEQAMLTVLFVVGVTFPLAFYHHSWSLWLGLDHLIEGLPRNI